MERFQTKCVINFGVGGSYPRSGLRPGDIAIALKEIYGDEGVISSKGWGNLKKIGIPLVKSGNKEYFNEFPLDKRLAGNAVKSAELIARNAGHGVKIKSGSFVTVCAASRTSKRASELEKRFKAVCENMEGASVAQVCTIYNIPMLEIRGISNISGVRDKRKWNLKLASYICQDVVLKLISCI
ncbi:MAG: futalosine hydrolase [Candidatus Mariimomonas ferrooxydans]